MKTVITMGDIRNCICRQHNQIRQYEVYQPGTWANADFRPLNEISEVDRLKTIIAMFKAAGGKVVE